MSVTTTMLEAFLQLTSSRQQVISENVANANRPGAKSYDVQLPQNFTDLVKTHHTNSIKVQTTHSSHLSGSKPNFKFKLTKDVNGELKPNGNNINLSNEAKKASENQILYGTALEAYKSSSKLVKTALGKNK